MDDLRRRRPPENCALPGASEDTVLECLRSLGIPLEFEQGLPSLQLAALPGWAGFTKWRAEENDYAWQQAYPVGLVKLLPCGWVVCAGNWSSKSVSVSWASMAPIAPSCASWTNSPRVLHAEEWIAWPAAGVTLVVRLRPNRASAELTLLAREWEQLTHHHQIEYGPRRESEPRNGDGSAPA